MAGVAGLLHATLVLLLEDAGVALNLLGGHPRGEPVVGVAHLAQADALLGRLRAQGGHRRLRLHLDRALRVLV